MRTFRVSAALTILILLCSSCSANSATSIFSTQSPASITKSPIQTETAASTSIIAAPDPSMEATKPSDTASPASSVEPAHTSVAPQPVRFNEDNLLQYFQFGMSYDDVEKRLIDLKIWITNENKNDDEPCWWNISTDNVDFSFDSKNQLYLIGVRDYLHSSNWETAKGLKIGDSLEKLHLLYGKEDEFDELHDEHIYYKNGYLFSVRINNENGIQNVVGWNFSINILNDRTMTNLKPGQAEGDFMEFNEDNFIKTFPFGMSHEKIEQKLIDLGVRIVCMFNSDANDDRYWLIETDHVSFYVDYYTDRLDCVEVKGWDTAKGLKEGDSIKRLHQLYGKESLYDKDDCAYIYKMKGYKFKVSFTDFNPQRVVKVSEWCVYNN